MTGDILDLLIIRYSRGQCQKLRKIKAWIKGKSWEYGKINDHYNEKGCTQVARYSPNAFSDDD
jgi:hypothetical protein